MAGLWPQRFPGGLPISAARRAARNRAFTLEREKGCACRPALLKEAVIAEKLRKIREIEP
jgi:hypothetical protein